LHDVFYSGNATLSQVLDETIVVDALRRECAEGASDKRNSIAGFKTALGYSALFWLVVIVAVALAI
jgi:hypothetical protein